MRLGHIHLKVTDLRAAEDFYCGILELKIQERVEGMFLFLSFGSAHHDIALQEVPGGVQAAHTAKRPISAGLYHTAFEVNTAREMLGVIHRLEAGAVQFSLVNHGISWALYTDDPSGNGVEVYLDRRTSATGSRVWGGASEYLSASAIADAAASEH